jgi:hypothetical protein
MAKVWIQSTKKTEISTERRRKNVTSEHIKKNGAIKGHKQTIIVWYFAVFIASCQFYFLGLGETEQCWTI